MERKLGVENKCAQNAEGNNSCHLVIIISCKHFPQQKAGIFGLVIMCQPLSSNELISTSNTEQGAKKDNIWIVHGQEYDLVDFVKHHPGGRMAIELGRGRDCTAMFESYHPFTNAHRIALKKYQVGDVNSNSSSKMLPGAGLDPFYDVLKERVAMALREKGIDPRKGYAATLGRKFYYFIVLACLAVFAFHHAKGNVFGSIAFGFFVWLNFALGHDGCHFSASTNPSVNSVSLWGMVLAFNPVMWMHEHTYGHHSHTNHFDLDPDVHNYDEIGIIRVNPKFKLRKQHWLQRSYVYVLLGFSIATLATCIKMPMDMMRTGWLHGVVEWTDRKKPLHVTGMLAGVVLYLVAVFVAPFVFSEKQSHEVLLACVLHTVVASLMMQMMTAVSHMNEHCVETSKTCKLAEKSWAADQVVTSQNFSSESFFWFVLSNGLNLQIEHHLFPGLNHCHLSSIAPVVQKTCEEFNVPYNNAETFLDAFKMFMRWLNKLSEDRTLKVATSKKVQ